MGSTEVTSDRDRKMAGKATKGLEGDWQFISEKGYDPVKVTVKNIMGAEWVVACMIPKCNMMASMLKKVEGGEFSLVKLNCSSRECMKENKELEDDFKAFLEKGISKLTRGERRVLVEDDIRKKQEEAQKAKMAGVGSGRF